MPTILPDNYGPPVENQGWDSYGPPSTSYGVPEKPSTNYGASNKPSSNYGPPAPAQEYGVPG